MAPDDELETEALRLAAGAPPPVPAHWVRLATIADESGYCAAADLAGRPATPGTVAAEAARQLRSLDVDVRTDGAGHPYADLADPIVSKWRA